jgi:hypothetical protein
MLPLNELIRRKDFIFNDIFKSNSLFVRPDSGAKEFSGRIVYSKNCNLEFFDYGFYHEDPNLLVVISSSKKIEKEWRLVVANKKVITGSQYKINCELESSPDCPEEIIEFGNKIVNMDWEPDPIYTIDVCSSNGKLYLLEINSFSCSGLYDCDIKKIVQVASEIALKSWKECWEI